MLKVPYAEWGTINYPVQKVTMVVIPVLLTLHATDGQKKKLNSTKIKNFMSDFESLNA